MDTKVISQEQANSVTPDLPPKGYQRDEVLAQRTDKLAEDAENLANQGVGKIDPKALKPDAEIQHLLHKIPDPLAVPGALPEFDYCWTLARGEHSKVWEKKAQIVSGMRSTWHVVQGDMPEAREYKAEDTTRRIGDVILMRILKSDHAILLQHQEYRRQLQEMGVAADLRELGDKYRGRGFIVHTNSDDAFASHKGGSVIDTLQRRASANLGMKVVDVKLREGTVPGMPVSGGG